MTSDAQPQLDPERQGQARTYGRIQRRLSILELLGGLAYLALWLGAGWGVKLQAAVAPTSSGGAQPFEPHWTIGLLIFVAVLGLPWAALTLPLSYYSGFILPHHYGLSTQTRRGWVTDQLKSAAVSALLGIPLLLGLYALIQGLPGTWWLLAAGSYSLVSVILTALAPVLLMPIFNRFEPLEQQYLDLGASLKALAEQYGTHVEGSTAWT
jgi:STE24 endopeptidase